MSGAVRTPSRIDRELANLPILAPSTDFVSEKLIAFEAGYRGQPTERTSLSVSIFVNSGRNATTCPRRPNSGSRIMRT